MKNTEKMPSFETLIEKDPEFDKFAESMRGRLLGASAVLALVTLAGYTFYGNHETQKPQVPSHEVPSLENLPSKPLPSKKEI